MSIAFDFSFEEIWPTWIAGATAGRWSYQFPTPGSRAYRVPRRAQDHSALLHADSARHNRARCTHPALLIIGGEVCPADLISRWSRPGRRMLNTYGPPETTLTATWCELFPGRPVTIGSPLPMYQIYILDDQLRLVEDGESGEICIGGPGVAIGYLNRPDLTKEHFIPNPVWRDREIVPAPLPHRISWPHLLPPERSSIWGESTPRSRVMTIVSNVVIASR